MTGLPSATVLLPARASRQVSGRECLAREVVCLLGLPFDTLTLGQAVEKLREAAVANTRCFVSTPNLNFVVGARRDVQFRDSVLRSDMSLADGAPIVWVARLLGVPMLERVAGASLFEALRGHPGPALRVYFFGGLPGAAAAACDALNAVPSGLHCVGHEDPGFGSVEDMSSPELIARINRSGAQFVVVSLGAKKGQAWLVRNEAGLDAPLLCHLGAVVNFVAGTVRRAPPVLQRLGLEWLWRIKEEPGLWRRYLNDGLAFVRIVAVDTWPLLRQRLRQATSTAPPGNVAARVGTAGDLTIRISGALGGSGLSLLRQALGEAVEFGRAVEVIFAGPVVVDAALIGSLLLAHGALGAAGLRLSEVPEAIASTLRQHGAGFLLELQRGEQNSAVTAGEASQHP